jgi:D-amino peptidase
MKVFINTDLEGISGVDTMEKVSDIGTPGHRFALERLMLDLNAAVDGAFEGGATHVYVADGHGRADNFLLEMLDKRAIMTKGKLHKLVTDGEIDAKMLVGAHAMAGTINGFLDHTLNSKALFNYIVNGRKSGEIAQAAIYMGAYNIPFIMVSGDEAACVEAKSFLGNIECAVVKYGIGRNNAKLVDLDGSLKKIKIAARDSLKLIGKIKPYKPLLPLDIRLEVYRSDMCDAIMENCKNVERLDARTVRKLVYKVESITDILFR